MQILKSKVWINSLTTRDYVAFSLRLFPCRCLSMLEGLAYNANPNFNIVDLVYPYVVSNVISGAEGTPYRSGLRNLVVDTS